MYAIDSNRIATSKQRNAVYAHYTNILGNKLSLSKSDRYTLFNRIRGAMTHYYLSVLNSSMTHGDVQEALQTAYVPSQLLTMIKIPESSEPKVVKTPVVNEPKVVKQEVKEQAPKKRGRPKGSKNSMTISSTNERIDQLENKLNKILEILSK